MRSRSNFGSSGRHPRGSQTNEPQRDRRGCQNTLYIVGIGPGRAEHLTRRAEEVLSCVDTVVGYTTYIDLIRSLIHGKHVVSTGMTKEVQRVESALEKALSGHSCALVSSGDPGIYAMAGLVFETCHARNIQILPQRDAAKTANRQREQLVIEIVPGIPALCAGASLLGAPLAHDFAVVSLSNLLTPWDIIAARLEAAAQADFVIVLYNPKSKKRTWQLNEAQQIIMNHRDKNTPVGIVRSAMRATQSVDIISLAQLHVADVDMQTTVFIGSRASQRYLDFMFTPRGYSQKYTIGAP